MRRNHRDSNTLNKRKIFILVLIGLVLVVTINLKLASKQQNNIDPQPPNISTAVQPAQTEVNLPVRLKISKINVDAALDYVGLTPEGDMDTPSTPAKAGWYRQGPRPGEEGSSVIDGHYGWVNDVPAVFDKLHTLQKGDKVQIEAKKGVTITFVVRELRMYAPNEEAKAVFRSSDGKPHLNLITCQGAWNKTQQSYSNRLVVFADKEME